MGNLGLGADRASSQEVGNVLPHPRPPKPALYKSQSAGITWVAGESGGVAPLEYLCPGMPGNILSPIGPRCFPNLPLDAHLHRVDEDLRPQVGLQSLRPFIVLKISGESVRLNVFRARSVGQVSLAQVQPLGRVQVLQVFMVRPHLEGYLRSLQPLPPLLNVVILLGWGQPVILKGAQV